MSPASWSSVTCARTGFMAGKEGRARWTGCSDQVLTRLLLSQLWFRFLLRNLFPLSCRQLTPTHLPDSDSYILPCRLGPSWHWPLVSPLFSFPICISSLHPSSVSLVFSLRKILCLQPQRMYHFCILAVLFCLRCWLWGRQYCIFEIFESNKHGFELWFCNLLSEWPWASCFASLSLFVFTHGVYLIHPSCLLKAFCMHSVNGGRNATVFYFYSIYLQNHPAKLN